jgi:hypothetical protein
MAQFLARWRTLLAEPPVSEIYRETTGHTDVMKERLTAPA